MGTMRLTKKAYDFTYKPSEPNNRKRAMTHTDVRTIRQALKYADPRGVKIKNPDKYLNASRTAR